MCVWVGWGADKVEMLMMLVLKGSFPSCFPSSSHCSELLSCYMIIWRANRYMIIWRANSNLCVVCNSGSKTRRWWLPGVSGCLQVWLPGWLLHWLPGGRSQSSHFTAAEQVPDPWCFCHFSGQCLNFWYVTINLNWNIIQTPAILAFPLGDKM